nr:transposase [Salinibacter ruber]
MKVAVVRTATTERSRAASCQTRAFGAPWRDMPERYRNWKTVYDFFRRWTEDGTLGSIVWHLQGELDAGGRIGWIQFNVDSTIVQAARAAASGPNDSKKRIEPGEMRE